MAWNNQLYFGDNLAILPEYVPDNSVDLIYLDPPFNSHATYNVLFAEHSGEKSAAQITAFEDTWHWGQEAAQSYHRIIHDGPPKIARLIESLHDFLGPNDMMAYLTMMAIRLVELQRVLKPTGCIYLHCDPTASHYLKLLMDAIFNLRNFQNEISWKRTTTKSDFRQGAKNWPRIRDVLLHYAKENEHQAVFNQPFSSYSEEYIASKYHLMDADGRRYMLDNLTAPGAGSRGHPQYEFMGVTRYWRYNHTKMDALFTDGKVIQPSHGAVPRYKRYLDEMKGIAIGDTWDDIFPINSMAQERLGYPTQKPEALLERIILASSNEGDTILDPFCGCGTAIAVSERLQRRWIGIDITHLAIALLKHRLHTSFGQEVSPYKIIGAPEDLASAKALAQYDRHQFEWWALGLVDARPLHDKKKGADQGIDGEIPFFDDNTGKAKRVIVQVKSGHVNSPQVRDLLGVLSREKAAIGLFITLEEPTRPMLTEAIQAGFYVPVNFPDHHYPRIQILTIEGLLGGKQAQYPRYAPAATFKRAPRRHKGLDPQQPLF